MAKRMRILPRRVSEEIGFGDKLSSENRLILRDGSFNVVRYGKRISDLYTDLLQLGWGALIWVLFTLYIVLNLLFGIIFYYLGPEAFGGVQQSEGWLWFAEACFFSIQTFTTVGYGAVHPLSLSANAVAGITAFTGLLWFAMATGLCFARFAKATVTVLFSDHAVIRSFEGESALMFRLVNGHNSNLRDLEVRVTLSWLDQQEGETTRRFTPLKLEMDQLRMFPLNWTLVHKINENSALYGWTAEEINEKEVELIIYLKAFDQTYAQTINRVHSYTAEEFQWGKRFKRMYYEEEGRTVLQLDWLDATEEE